MMMIDGGKFSFRKTVRFIFLPFLLQVILILQNSLGVKEQFSTAKNFALMSKFLQNHLLVLSFKEIAAIMLRKLTDCINI
jgi:hypothetical protein